jgi:hypothetical protein
MGKVLIFSILFLGIWEASPVPVANRLMETDHSQATGTCSILWNGGTSASSVSCATADCALTCFVKMNWEGVQNETLVLTCHCPFSFDAPDCASEVRITNGSWSQTCNNNSCSDSCDIVNWPSYPWTLCWCL